MSLKSMFSALKSEGYVIKPLDLYLLGLNEVDEDRLIDINAPSQAGACLRSRYYSRTRAERDGGTIDARTRRIFDNGTGVHERIQSYLISLGLLLMAEMPVHNTEYKIQGHTDGLLALSPLERGVLEIKSINSRGFSELRDAKEDHKKQGLIYLYCLEEHRKFLRETYPTELKFRKYAFKRRKQYEKMYDHVKGGSKYSREEKITFQADLHMTLDRLLWETETPISKAIFLYENKDTQDLKEFTVSLTEASAKNTIREVLREYALLNQAVENGIEPEREGKGRADNVCRWCAYKITCWN